MREGCKLGVFESTVLRRIFRLTGCYRWNLLSVIDPFRSLPKSVLSLVCTLIFYLHIIHIPFFEADQFCLVPSNLIFNLKGYVFYIYRKCSFCCLCNYLAP
jgi:hypothetical protein